MKIRYFFTFIIFCVAINTFSQTSLNDYKYVIVPKQFNFQKSPHQYQLNRLTKLLFNKYGFNVVYEGEELPSDLKSNYCLALNSNVESVGFFNTKTVLTLVDCNGKTIFTSKETFTNEKDFKKAYTITITEAFKSLESINYSYTPNKNVTAQASKINTTTNQEIQKLKEEIKSLKTEQNKIVIKTENEKVVEKLDTEINELKEETNDSVEVAKIRDAKVVAKIEEENSVEEIVKAESKKTTQSDILYAQEIDNGFQVVDSTPKVVMILITTPKQDTFIVKGKSAIVYKEDGFWYLSENKGNTTVTKILSIKF